MDEAPPKLTEALAEFKLAPAKEKKLLAKMENIVVEERQFGVSGEARDDFARLYDLEIQRLGKCPLPKIGWRKPKKKKTPGLDEDEVVEHPRCSVPLLNFQHFLVHHQIHLMIMSDSRVQKQTNSQALDLVYPMSEKTMRAALGPEERKRMLKDPELRKRRELQGG